MPKLVTVGIAFLHNRLCDVIVNVIAPKSTRSVETLLAVTFADRFSTMEVQGCLHSASASTDLLPGEIRIERNESILKGSVHVAQ